MDVTNNETLPGPQMNPSMRQPSHLSSECCAVQLARLPVELEVFIFAGGLPKVLDLLAKGFIIV